MEEHLLVGYLLGSTGTIIVENTFEKDTIVKSSYERDSYSYDAADDAESEKQVVDMAVDMLVDEQEEIEDLKELQQSLIESSEMIGDSAQLDEPVEPVDFTVDMSIASVAAISFTVLITIAAFTALVLFIIDRLRKASLQICKNLGKN